MRKRFTPIVTIVALCWIVFGINLLVFRGHLVGYGIVPRQARGLPGILWAPFLHGSMEHIVANTVPLLVLGAVLSARSVREFWGVTISGILLTGVLTWLFARSASHIGASGLIFCLFGYLAFQSLFRRTFGALIVTVICLVAYGGIIRGVLPTSSAISWEGHLAGLVAGIFLAWLNGSAFDNSPAKAD